ncbi:MAG: hypothetical protein CVU38_00245 [Chloroflexi bacterium HGW-Chloroflexi-1]|nr:MAG: hypothetical protein CVU38_00245 [Chloroflexi bacterium HGW-Chloroflexi-1]
MLQYQYIDTEIEQPCDDVLLDSPGPVLYVQKRSGRGGRPFWLSKFRSMTRNRDHTPRSIAGLLGRTSTVMRHRRRWMAMVRPCTSRLQMAIALPIERFLADEGTSGLKSAHKPSQGFYA